MLTEKKHPMAFELTDIQTFVELKKPFLSSDSVFLQNMFQKRLFLRIPKTNTAENEFEPLTIINLHFLPAVIVMLGSKPKKW